MGEFRYLNSVGRLVLICLVAGCFFPRSVFSGSSPVSAENCISTCHDDVWRDIQNKRYIHQPVRQKDCKYCHAALNGDSEEKRQVYSNIIKWLARSVSPSQEHWLEIDDAKRGATLLVESRWPGGMSAREFPLPAFDELESFPVGDPQSLKILNPRVLEVSKGIFVSVVIGWETDRPADSQVFYGLDKPDQRSMLDGQYTMRHSVALTGVKPGKTYKYQVVSIDVAGNRSESNVQSMVTDVAQGEKHGKAVERISKEPEITVRYYRKDTKCIVVVGADRDVSVAIGILPKKYEKDNSESGVKVVRHLQLNSPEGTNTGVCYNCHVEYKKILTHPINVYPKPGMVIPPEYSTLPDGRISCMSCHAVHASNVEYRVIKANKRDLCRGCHRDMP